LYIIPGDPKTFGIYDHMWNNGSSENLMYASGGSGMVFSHGLMSMINDSWNGVIQKCDQDLFDDVAIGNYLKHTYGIILTHEEGFGWYSKKGVPITFHDKNVNDYYEKFEKDVTSVIEEFIIRSKHQLYKVFSYFNAQYGFIQTKFINRTKFQLIKAISSSLIGIAYGEVLNDFQNFLNHHVVSSDLKVALNTNFLEENKSYNDIYEKLHEIASMKHSNSTISKFITLLFISERKKIEENPINVYVYANQWRISEEENFREVNDYLKKR